MNIIIIIIHDIFYTPIHMHITQIMPFPTWWGLIGSIGLLQLLLSRAVKQSFFPPKKPVFDNNVRKNDVGLFNAIMNDHYHVLSHLFSPVKKGVYNLCQRNYNRIISDIRDSRLRKTFINRTIFLTHINFSFRNPFSNFHLGIGSFL